MASTRDTKKGGNGGLYGTRNAAAIDWEKRHGWSIVEEIIKWASARAGYPDSPSPTHLVELVLAGQAKLGETPSLAKSAITNWRRNGYFGLPTQRAVSIASGIPEQILIDARRKKESGDNTPIPELRRYLK